VAAGALVVVRPAIVRERLGPVAALRRSNELVRGHFELVFLTAAFAVILEEAVLSAGAFVGLVVSGSETWGEWAGGSVAALLLLPCLGPPLLPRLSIIFFRNTSNKQPASYKRQPGLTHSPS
jgi:hypothetical protein